MQRILASIILSFLICSPLWSLSWSSVNIDKVTAAAMSAAYETETLVEGNTASNINKIFDHYQSAGLASAGIFQSMKKLRDARRNPGLFASEENYYYQRIFRLVKDGIMPKFITVAGKMLKQPDNAIHWGPYLLKTTTNVENLCKQFEVVVTNGKRSFKDIRFLVLNEDLQRIFDLAQLGEVDWKSLLGKLGNLEQASPKRKSQRITRIWEVSLRRQEKPPMTATWKVPARLVLYSRPSPRRLPNCISPSKPL